MFVSQIKNTSGRDCHRLYINICPTPFFPLPVFFSLLLTSLSYSNSRFLLFTTVEFTNRLFVLLILKVVFPLCFNCSLLLSLSSRCLLSRVSVHSFRYFLLSLFCLSKTVVITLHIRLSPHPPLKPARVYRRLSVLFTSPEHRSCLVFFLLLLFLLFCVEGSMKRVLSFTNRGHLLDDDERGKGVIN